MCCVELPQWRVPAICARVCACLFKCWLSGDFTTLERFVSLWRSRMNYYKLIIASSYLRYVPGVRFVATNPDKTLPIHDGLVRVCVGMLWGVHECARVWVIVLLAPSVLA